MDWMLFAVFLLACGAAWATGALFPPGEWYRSLDKPRWTPPNWMFPLVWTLLYASIAFAAARVAPLPESQYALGFWAAQIAFNTLWTPVFFGLRRMRAALVVMLLLWLTVAATLVAMWPLDRLAALLFVPYLAWVSVAGMLNLSLVRRNPQAASVPAAA
ncbi:MAG: tryptophan-rich sensory protein [Gammaproteobacteria bacterium]|nr:tryptophan-rich sensory protein [Gammaproteobacteria bacterium]